MTDSDEKTLDAFIEAGTEMLGLPVDPAWMPAIRANLKVTLRHGAVFGEMDLPDELEAAPIFRA